MGWELSSRVAQAPVLGQRVRERNSKQTCIVLALEKLENDPLCPGLPTARPYLPWGVGGALAQSQGQTPGAGE